MKHEIIEINGKDYKVLQRKEALPNIGAKYHLVLEQVLSKKLWTTYQRENGEYTKVVRAI